VTLIRINLGPTRTKEGKQGEKLWEP